MFDEIYASSESINKLNQSQVSTDAIIDSVNLNYLLGKGLYFEDSSGIIFKSADLFYTRANIAEDLDIGFDAGLFSIEKNRFGNADSDIYKGSRYGASLLYKEFIFRLGINKFEHFSEIVPSVEYHGKYDNHSYKLEYKKQNAMFYTYSVCPVVEEIDTHHFAISDYVAFENKTDLWMSLIANFYENSDLETTFQFDWRFYQDRLFSKNFTYSLAIDGWYTAHTKQHRCFYSPDFSDSTLLRVDPQYIFNQHIGIKGTLGTGYSATEDTRPYKYGVWIFGNINKDSSYTAGCLHSNAARLSHGPEYHYEECTVDVDYRW